MKVQKIAALSIMSAFGLMGCSAIKLNPNAHRVIATRTPAPKGCKYVGSVVGSQGGAFTGGWTSNKNLAEGSMNDMKNKAANMGANYVQIEADRAGVTGSGGGASGLGAGSLEQTDVTWNGNAYYCDPREIGLE
jgi:hypothetical protein